MIQNYQTRALSDTDENKTHTPIKLSNASSSTSEHVVEFLPTTAARMRPRPRTRARLPRATHAQRLEFAVHPLFVHLGRHAVFFLYRDVNVGLLVYVRISTATSEAIVVRWVGRLWPWYS